MLPRAIVSLLLVLTVARSAFADEADTRAARRHFERGEKLYALTKFREAIDEYQRAFEAKPLPDFLFNIGQCYRNLEEYDAAIFSYRKYLRLAPDAANREQVEQLIRELEAKQTARESRRLRLSARPEEAATSPPAARDDAPVYRRWWFWTGVAVLGAAGGVGIYAATRAEGPPATNLGNIVFGK